MNPTVESVLKHKKANMRKSEFLMLEALKSAPHQNNMFGIVMSVRIFEVFNRIHNAIESPLLFIIVWVGGDETIQQLLLSC